MEIKLNLIPEYRRVEIGKAERFRFTIKTGFLLSFVLVFLLVGLVFFNYILRINLGFVSNTIQLSNRQSDYDKVKKMDSEFRKINEEINRTNNIQKSQLYWSTVLGKIDDLTPDSISVGELATNNYKIIISGVAQDRDALLSFKDNLEKDGCFDSVSLPLSDLVTKENINFELDFDVKKECLQKS